MLRFFKTIPIRSVQIALACIGLVIVGYVALTRTEVGREELRLQMMQQFNDAYQGELAIGTLRGNLLNELYATDVRLWDDQERLFLHLDSVALRHNWTALFGAPFSIRSLRIHAPTLHLHVDSLQAWNTAAVFRPKEAKPDASQPPLTSIRSANLEIVNGTLHTSRAGPAPRQVADSTLFDYTQTTVTAINLQTTVELSEASSLLDVGALSFRLDDQDLSVLDVYGQVLLQEGAFALNNMVVVTEASVLRLKGSTTQFPGNDLLDWQDATVEVELEDATISHAEIRRLFPKWPLATETTVRAHLHGPLSELVVDQFALAQGASRVEANGTILGFPDSLDVDVTVLATPLRADDVRALAPSWLAVEDIQIQDLQLAASTQGTLFLSDSLTLSQGTFTTEVRGSSQYGHLSGEVTFSQPPETTPRFETGLTFDSLQIGQMLNRPAWHSQLTGRLEAQGAVSLGDDLSALIDIQLGRSTFQERQADSLGLRVNLAGREVVGEVTYWLEAGRLDAEAYANLGLTPSPFQVDLSTSNLNVGPLFRADSLTTDFTSKWTLVGSAQDLATISGEWDMQVDSSRVTWGDDERMLDPHQLTVRLDTPRPDSTHLELSGSVVQGVLHGTTDPMTLLAWTNLWSTLGRDAIQRSLAKPYRPYARYLAPPLAALLPTPTSSSDYQAFAQTVEQALVARAQPNIDLQAEFQLLRSDILTVYLPAPAMLASDARGAIRFSGDARTLEGHLTLNSDSLQMASYSANGMQTESLLLGARLDEEVTFAGNTVSQADSVRLGNFKLVDPRLVATLADTTATLRLDAQQSSPSDTLLLDTQLTLLPDRNRLRVQDLAFSASGTLWATDEPALIDLYQDAIVTPQVILRGQHENSSYRQQFRARGALSSLSTDTLFVGSENIVIRHLSDFAAARFPLGGLFNGEIALVGSLQAPEITGRVAIHHFALRDQVLGDVSISSQYIPGSPALDITLALTPTDSALHTATIIGTNLPAFYNNNQLSLQGTVELPQANDSGTSQPSALDLALDVTRADLFFFELIYPFALDNVNGYLDGSGTITGSLDYPVFEASLETNEASFEIPKFGLRYAAEGTAVVDSTSIHVPELIVTDRTQGQARVDGSFGFNNYDYFSFDLDGQLDDLLIMDMAESDTLPFYGHIWTSGDVTLTGPVYGATLRSANAVTSTESDLYIPILEEEEDRDQAFIIFADSTGEVSNFRDLTRRRNVVAPRPVGERSFAESVNMDLNVFAPPGSSINLVFDALLGDVLRGVGSGRVQILREGGDFSTFGRIDINSGDYLFTAGDVFARRFTIQEGGSLIWDGNPINAQLNIPAIYRTRASSSGLPDNFSTNNQIPVNVLLNVTGRVLTPIVDLSLEVDRSNREILGNYQAIETFLNQPERSTEYATSVLLTNTFLLTTSDVSRGSALSSSSSLTFNSVSQLVSSQINRILSEALPNVDVNFGVSQKESLQTLDVTGDVAFYLLNERLVIRGQGVVFQNDPANSQQALEGEVEVEMRLTPSVAVEVFLRREGDVFADNLTNTRGAGLSYQTQFSSWRALARRLFGWIGVGKKSDEDSQPRDEPVASPES